MSEAYALEPETPEEDAGEPQKPQGADFLQAAIGNPNLAFDLDESTLAQMGAKVIEEFGIDDESRKAAGWNERDDAAMKLALQTREVKNTPWPNASNVKYPLISTAAIQFNARAYPAIIDGPEVVKGAVKGKPSPEKVDRAQRIGAHMSYQLLEEMDDWEEDTDRLLIQLPIVGCAFRKSWFDPLKGYNCSHLVSAGDFVVNYWTKDLETCPRATHVLTFYPHEVKEKQLSGLWLDVDLGRPQSAANDDQAPFTFYEQARLWDLDDDGYPEPYTITVEKDSGKVVRVVARYDERGIKADQSGKVIRIEATRNFTKYGFIPAPDGSFYDIGFGTLLNPLSESINTILNQLTDAGTLANLGGGFIGEGVSIKSGVQGFRPGEWKKAGTAGASLKDSIVPLPTREPSSVLFQLLGMMIEAAKDVTATQDILGGDAGKGTLPVGTVSALIEQGLKTFTAIVKRIHRALKKELRILYDLNARFLDPEVYFTFQDDEKAVAQQDYVEGDCDVVPVSDPNMATDMQRMAQAQFVVETAKNMPGTMQPGEVVKRALAAARVPEPEKLLTPPGPPPPDPKMIVEHAKAMLEERKQDREDLIAATNIEATQVQTETARAQLMAMGPEMAQFIELQVQAGIDRILERLGNGGSPQAQPGNVPGMGQQPPDQGVPGVPPGPAGQAGGPMGGGPGDGQPSPDQGPPAGGAFDAGMG